MKTLSFRDLFEDSQFDFLGSLDDLPVGIYRTSLEGQLVAANSELVRIFGFDSLEELVRYPIVNLYRDKKDRGALIARNIPFTAYKELRELPFVKLGRYKSGLVFERRENRRRPFGKLAARTVGIDREQQRVGIERAWNEELSGVEGQQLSRKVAGNQWMPVTDDYLVDPVEGMDVVTTLNLHLQDVATTALERQLRTHDAAWGTVIVCEVQTGHIQAISNLTRHESANGTVEYWEDFNHAIGTAVEPGSTFKLFPYAAAIDRGIKPEDIFVDTPRCWRGYCPKNFGAKYFGPVSLADALKNSLNTVAVQVQDQET